MCTIHSQSTKGSIDSGITKILQILLFLGETSTINWQAQCKRAYSCLAYRTANFDRKAPPLKEEKAQKKAARYENAASA